jgi:hypothetical protein
MYSLGIPISQYRRCTSVLGHESSEPIEYNVEKQDRDFYLFMFPSVDEFGFRDIVKKLKLNGITTIGADDHLTERNIMKLVDILNEQESPQDNDNLEDAQGIIDKLNNILSLWQTKKYETDKQRWEEYYLDISELVQDWEEETSMKGIALDSPLNESIKKLVKKEIQKLLK